MNDGRSIELLFELRQLGVDLPQHVTNNVTHLRLRRIETGDGVQKREQTLRIVTAILAH